MSGMRKVALLAAAGLALVVAVAVMALWPGDSSTPPPGAAASPSAASPRHVRPSGISAVPGTPRASQSGSQSTGGPAAVDNANGFLTELGAIDPALVTDRDGALEAGQTTCADLKAGKSYDAVVRATEDRFKAQQPKATLIVDAARNHLCPG